MEQANRVGVVWRTAITDALVQIWSEPTVYVNKFIGLHILKLILRPERLIFRCRILTCHLCGNKLQKDHIALNKKLLSRNINKYFCLNCTADYLESTVDDLLVKIEEFKEQGCILFK